jgi:hypothetical protein
MTWEGMTGTARTVAGNAAPASVRRDRVIAAASLLWPDRAVADRRTGLPQYLTVMSPLETELRSVPSGCQAVDRSGWPIDPDASHLNIRFLARSTAPRQPAWPHFRQHIVSELQYRTASNLAAVTIDRMEARLGDRDRHQQARRPRWPACRPPRPKSCSVRRKALTRRGR